ncbi:MAG: ATP synthase F0 subunit B [Myxococcales bacterium]|nr:ATP synthase F0 subunit B [Myxococcales bacterium]
MTNLRMRSSTPAPGAMASPTLGRARTVEFCVRTAAWIVFASLIATPAYASGKLVLLPNPTTLVPLIIAFVLLIGPLNAMIFRPLLRVLDERDAKIAGATHEAGQLVERARELTQRYRETVREARDDAEVARKQQLEAARSEHASITNEARAQSEVEIRRARVDIEGALVEARETLEATSRDLAKVAAERILGRPLQ